MADKITFETGVPAILALKFSEGKLVDSRFGKEFQFSTPDDRIFWLKPDAAQDLHEGLRNLGIRAGEEFMLTKTDAKHLRVERTVAPRRGDAGGHNMPANAPTWEDFEARYADESVQRRNAQPARLDSAATNAAPVSPTNKLMASYMAAIDTLVEAQAYAARKGLVIAFTGEDVRSTAISAYIQLGKDGR
jgi:hypothetical protein